MLPDALLQDTGLLTKNKTTTKKAIRKQNLKRIETVSLNVFR